jgi:hypothetical protein
MTTTTRKDDPKAAPQASPRASPAPLVTTSTVTNTFLYHFRNLPQFGGMLDNRQPGPASAQGTATPLTAAATQVTQSVASGSLILKSILDGNAQSWVIVVNVSGQTVLIYPAAGENLGGTLNASLSVPSGQCAIFLPVLNAVPGGGGPDWRCAVFT